MAPGRTNQGNPPATRLDFGNVIYFALKVDRTDSMLKVINRNSRRATSPEFVTGMFNFVRAKVRST